MRNDIIIKTGIMEVTIIGFPFGRNWGLKKIVSIKIADIKIIERGTKIPYWRLAVAIIIMAMLCIRIYNSEGCDTLSIKIIDEINLSLMVISFISFIAFYFGINRFLTVATSGGAVRIKIKGGLKRLDEVYGLIVNHPDYCYSNKKSAQQGDAPETGSNE